jgi:Flp pilus assembly protein TadG
VPWRRVAPPGRDVDRDTGSFSLELAVLFPAFLLLILVIVQAALFFFARSVASSAAQQGADTARLQGNTAADGVSTATSFVTGQGGGILDDVAVTTNGGSATQVSITVTGHALTIIPGVTFTVRQSATAPRERYTTANAAGLP